MAKKAKIAASYLDEDGLVLASLNATRGILSIADVGHGETIVLEGRETAQNLLDFIEKNIQQMATLEEMQRQAQLIFYPDKEDECDDQDDIDTSPLTEEEIERLSKKDAA